MNRTHQMTVDVCSPETIEAEAGTEIALSFRVTCPSGCDLQGSSITLRSGDSVVTQAVLTLDPSITDQTQDLRFSVPLVTGPHQFQLICSNKVGSRVPHADGAAVVALDVKAHKTSLAVWDVPSPVIVNTLFSIKVGARCSGGCVLAGCEVEVVDEAGRGMSSATLGSEPWPGTTGLLWTNVDIQAPPDSGIHTWSVGFRVPEKGVPHESSGASLRLNVVQAPEHCVTVEICARDTRKALSNVEVRLGPFRASTNERGIAVVEVPGGAYELNVWKAEYEVLSRGMDVNGEVTVHLELVPAPEPEDPYWMGGPTATSS